MRAIIVVLVIALILCCFAFISHNNDERVNVNKQPFADGAYMNVALAEVVFWAFAAGSLLSLFIFIMIYIKQTVLYRSARRRIKALEAEVTILRNRPIEESADLIKGADLKAQRLNSPFDSSRGNGE